MPRLTIQIGWQTRISFLLSLCNVGIRCWLKVRIFLNKKGARVLAWIKKPSHLGAIRWAGQLALRISSEIEWNKQNIVSVWMKWFGKFNGNTLHTRRNVFFSHFVNLDVADFTFTKTAVCRTCLTSGFFFSPPILILEQGRRFCMRPICSRSDRRLSLPKKNWQICFGFFVFFFEIFVFSSFFSLQDASHFLSGLVFALFFAVASKYFKLGSSWMQCYYFGRHTHTHTLLMYIIGIRSRPLKLLC